MGAEMHADLLPLRFLLGTWRGAGKGEYPTIEPFDYEEEMRFEDVGDAFLVYEQSSWSPVDRSPIHLERGFLRPGRNGHIELVLAHPIGLTEVSEGPLVGTTFELTSRDVARTSTGLDATSLVRRYRVDGPEMSYRTDMATERTALALHLRGELRRVPG
jgi:hypothetical protein